MSRTFPESRRNARGFAAITAVFILVVLGMLGAVLVTVFSGQQRSSAFDALGSQAYFAARSGVELGAYQAINDGCGNVPASFVHGQMTVFLECSSSTHYEAAQTVMVYEITATACNRSTCTADGVSYVERQLRMTVTQTGGGSA